MKLLKRLIIFLGSIFLVLIILSFILFSIVKHLRIKEMVEHEIEHSLGINVSMERIEFSPLLAYVGARGITVDNPAGFREKELAYIESIHFVWDPVEILLRKKPNIYLFALNLKRLHIIKNKEGKVNIKELIPIKDQDYAAQEKEPFYFEVMVLSIGEVRYTDYSGSAKKEYKYPINLKNATFVGVKDENEVIKIIVYKAIENTAIGQLINLTVKPVISQISNTLDSAWGTAKTGAKGIWEITTIPFKLFSGVK